MADVRLPNGQILRLNGVDDPEQAKKIAANYYAKNFADSDTPAQPAPTSKPMEIDRSGVKNGSLRAYLARAENDEEYEKRLNKLGFDSEMYMKDPEGAGYVLNLDRVSQDLKDKYDLQGRGMKAVEDDGISRYDFREFFASNRGAILGGIAVPLAFTGVGLVPAMLLAGAGSAGGYLLDEGLEVADRTQAQSLKSVGKSAAVEFGMGMAGEFGGRIIASGLGRLIKGPGGDAANAQRAATREDLLSEGLRPGLEEATTSPIRARLQGFYEGIFPNKAAAEENAKIIAKMAKDQGVLMGRPATDADGNIVSQFFDEGGRRLDANDAQDSAKILELLQRDVNNIYGDVGDLVKQGRADLDGVINDEIENVKNMFDRGNPEQVGEFVAESLERSKRIFEQDVDAIYKKADDYLGSKKIFNAKRVKNAFNTVLKNNPVQADQLRKSAMGKYIQCLDDMIDVRTASSLRTALNEAGYNDSIIGSTNSQIINDLIAGVNKGFDEAEVLATQAAEVARGTKGAPRGEGGKFVGKDVFIGEEAGLLALREAGDFYKEGVKKFQGALQKKLYSDFKRGVDFNPEAIIDPKFGLVVPNNRAPFDKFLESVVPTAGVAKPAPQSLKEVVPEIMVDLKPINGQQGKMPLAEVIESLPMDNPVRQHYQKIFDEQVQFAEGLAKTRSAGKSNKEAVRSQLAGAYLNKMFETQKSLDGTIDPAKVAEAINALGSTKNALFGDQTANVMRVLTDLTATKQKLSPEFLQQLQGQPVADAVQALRSALGQEADLTGDALFRSMQRSLDANDLEGFSRAVLKGKSPLNITKAKEMTKDMPNAPSATMEFVRDEAMKDILMSATDDTALTADEFIEMVSSGKHAKALRTKLDSYGPEKLTALFGKEVSDSLYKLANVSGRVGAAKMGSGESMGAGAKVIGLGAAFVAAPLAAVASMGGIKLLSTLYRKPWFLNMVTRPTGVRPGKGDYDKVGLFLERLYATMGQFNAGAANEGRQMGAAMADPERQQMRQQTQPARRTSQPVPSAPARQVQIPQRVTPTDVANSPQLNPALLGGNPQEQAINAEIQRRLKRYNQ